MSGNSDAIPAAPPSAPVNGARADLRTRRTRDQLGDALVQLIQEKPFDDITVQEVLDRAGVARSTFYTHYRDKQDLFLSDVEDFLEVMATLLDRRGAPPSRIAPVEELFAHVADVREFLQALTASGKIADVRELGLGTFARSIEKRLAAAGVDLLPAELRATAQALAGALFSMLDHWIAQKEPLPPKEMDAVFHRIVWNGLKPSVQPSQ